MKTLTFNLNLKLTALISLAFVSTAMAEVPAMRLPGMQNEIVIKSAAELSIRAPSGGNVAVLDQTVAGVSKSQDHHNGWLSLSTGQVEGDQIQVKGLYYIPSTAAVPATGIRLTIRKRSKTGLTVYSDKTLPISVTRDQWVGFVIDLPLKKIKPETAVKYDLLLSAVPLAGPVYLDNLQVTDPQNNQLWEYPEFE